MENSQVKLYFLLDKGVAMILSCHSSTVYMLLMCRDKSLALLE